ncbi:MAG: flagellar export protein FliJ [Lachnospiraceae bacterium]|nr:flagellar export protein FliJ [Lachnospiraceae bacterium]MCR4595380.1 flagellar export protein FliJ [Lachnospiraceae bacterium]
MAVFRYRLQNILNIKQQLQTQAEMEFGLAQSRLNEEEARLEKLIARKEGYIEEGRRMRLDDIDVVKLAENERSVKVMDEFIEGQRENVRLAERAVEAARAKLTEAMKEVKVQEKLREHAFEEFVEEQKAVESKEIDELVSYRYGQKGTGV